MRFNIRNELIPLNILVLILIVIIVFFPSNILRIIIGGPFLLFLPGYTLLAAMFPKIKSLGGVERLALSFGLSIAVVPLIGFILTYTPWGLGVGSVLYSMVSFIWITSVVAWLRRKRLPEEERFSFELQLTMPGWDKAILNRTLSIILIIAILGAMGTLGYVLAKPKLGEKFTEFYVLGSYGKAEDYPEEITLGEEGRVIIGIVNHEKETMSYEVKVKINGVIKKEMKPFLLGDERTWEEVVTFTPEKLGDNQKVEFLLYQNGESELYMEPLYLWIDVTGS